MHAGEIRDTGVPYSGELHVERLNTRLERGWKARSTRRKWRLPGASPAA